MTRETANRLVDRASTLTAIARTHLDLETLAERRSDRLDFHEHAVWAVRAALEAAYDAGRAAGHLETAPQAQLVPTPAPADPKEILDIPAFLRTQAW
jgi:hypothetical protein